jgi:excinuclease ABC subunit A
MNRPSRSKPRDTIQIRGAREHNLANLDVEIPKRKLVVFTGPSGSGKSSLAFDTIYAEGRRRYVESLSLYARQFLGSMDKADFDQILGLSPTISIEQKTGSSNPRSTVGTVTEIWDHLRIMLAQLGEQRCYNCGQPVSSMSTEAIVREIVALPERTKFMLLAPLVRNRKGEFKDMFDRLRKAGFVRARIDDAIYELENVDKLKKTKKHDIDVVVDRLIAKPGNDVRVAESVERGLVAGEGRVVLAVPAQGDQEGWERLFSRDRSCSDCGISYPELTHQSFSFNSPVGMCPSCRGIGTKPEIEPDLFVVDPDKSLRKGGIAVIGPAPEERGWKSFSAKDDCEPIWESLLALEEEGLVDLDQSWSELDGETKDLVLDGDMDIPFGGVTYRVEKARKKTRKSAARRHFNEFVEDRTCPDCQGSRLRPESRSVFFRDLSAVEINARSIARLGTDFTAVELDEREAKIGAELLAEIRERLHFLEGVGLGYLSLGRSADSLSGGESQRIRLASQLGSELSGILYILDEPSIGLHQRDNVRLLDTLQSLRDRGNSIIVVEHDRETMEVADWILDFGPGAGRAGGEIVACGPLQKIIDTPGSITGDYLAGRRQLEPPAERREGSGDALMIRGARHNNLKGVDVEIPTGRFVCVTGVSGAGKSSLVNDILYPAVARHVFVKHRTVGEVDSIEGLDLFDKVIEIDQTPIGRTPRSNPATYTKVFDHIRELFANLPESRMYGFDRGRFSFNVKGGRCEECKGGGAKKVEMNFLADVYVPCEVCRGQRFNHTTLMVRYRDKNISDVLRMTVEEAHDFFKAHPKIRRILQTLMDVGLDYLHLGQPSTTLSGGEAQRIKLSRELAKVATGDTLYILDEPSTGLHFDDIRKLLGVVDQLVDAGNTVVMIEHNLDIIKYADWLIDMGPDGGESGGEVVAVGPPEEVAKVERSFTGRFLADIL